MMDAERISLYAETSMETLVDALDQMSREAGEDGRPYSEGMLYTAARRLERLVGVIALTAELPEDCWLPPEVDAEWFRDAGDHPHYRPISEAGWADFGQCVESERYPGFYAFFTLTPEDWPSLTFAEITPPEPRR